MLYSFTSSYSYAATYFVCVYTLVPQTTDLNQIVLPKIMAEWDDVAFALGYEIDHVKSIERKHNNDPEECCKELLADWLTTDNGASPKVWSTLLEKLKKVIDLAAAREEIIKEVEKITN